MQSCKIPITHSCHLIRNFHFSCHISWYSKVSIKIKVTAKSVNWDISTSIIEGEVQNCFPAKKYFVDPKLQDYPKLSFDN